MFRMVLESIKACNYDGCGFCESSRHKPTMTSPTKHLLAKSELHKSDKHSKKTKKGTIKSAFPVIKLKISACWQIFSSLFLCNIIQFP